MKIFSSVVLLLCVSVASGFLWFGTDENQDEDSAGKDNAPIHAQQRSMNITTITHPLGQQNPKEIGPDDISLIHIPGPWSKLPWVTIENGHMDGFKRAKLNKEYPTKFIIPGFFQTCNSDFPKAIIKAYLQRMQEPYKEYYNIFCLNWKDYSGNIRISNLDFVKVCSALEIDVANTAPMVASNATDLLLFLLENGGIASNRDIHIIGFGIGSHIGGMIGNNLKAQGERVGRITALDPSSYGKGMARAVDELTAEGHRNPLYRTVNKNDADFVDVIHTDAWPSSWTGIVNREKRFGTTETMGHVDYFPNGGNVSPHVNIYCRKEITSTMTMLKQFASEFYFCRGKYASEGACRHNLAFHFYAQSILDPSIKAYKAKTYRDYQRGDRHPQPATFGEHININTTEVAFGTYYLEITPKRIFKKVCFDDIPESMLSSSRNTNVLTPEDNFEHTNMVSGTQGSDPGLGVPSDSVYSPECQTDKANTITFWYNPGGWSDNYATPLHYNLSETFEDSKLQKEYPFVFLIHGFLENGATDFASHLTAAYRKNMVSGGTPQINIISVSWGALSANQRDVNEQLYSEVVNNNLEIVANRLAQFIVFLQNQGYLKANFSEVHIIGHSLGAIIAGITGKKLHEMTNHKVQRITGLDPAGPLIPSKFLLDRECANFVDIVHTDMNTTFIDLPLWGEFGLGFGTDRQSGDIDYYPNGGGGGIFNFIQSFKDKLVHPFGPNQPCCWTVPGGFLLNVCAHSLSYKYYAVSIDSSKRISAYQCPSYRSYKCCKYSYLGCSKDQNVTFGEYVDQSEAKRKYGKFYLTLGENGEVYDQCTAMDCLW